MDEKLKIRREMMKRNKLNRRSLSKLNRRSLSKLNRRSLSKSYDYKRYTEQVVTLLQCA